MRTGILGGSFNPVHNGHIAIARGMIEHNVVDEVALMVSPQNPIKPINSLLPENVRLLLAQMACNGEKNIFASDFEFSLARPSYTWDTLCSMRKSFPEKDFVLLIGADNWKIFSQWRNNKDIINNFEIAIYPRLGFNVYKSLLPPNVKYVDMPLYNISSTEIRDKISLGKDVSDYLPHAVYSEIKSKRYFRTHSRTVCNSDGCKNKPL